MYCRNTRKNCRSPRLAIDAMRWSDVKWEAIHDICRLDESQSVNSYIFQNVRFHNRWMELTENDFEFVSLENHYELKGFSALSQRGTAGSEFEPIIVTNLEAYSEPEQLMMDYLDKAFDFSSGFGFTDSLSCLCFSLNLIACQRLL